MKIFKKVKVYIFNFIRFGNYDGNKVFFKRIYKFIIFAIIEAVQLKYFQKANTLFYIDFLFIFINFK